MAITTYSELKTAVLAWSARSDLSSTIQDEVIDMAESLFKRAPRYDGGMGGIRADKSRATGTLTAGTATLSLPSDYLELDRLVFTDTGGGNLEYLVPDELRRRFRSGSGRPRYFTVSDVIEFDVAPDTAYAYELSYWPTFDALSGSQTTNWLINNYPDVYLSACLYFTGKYIMDVDMETRWGAEYVNGAKGVNDAYRRGRQSQGPMYARPDSSTP